VNFKEAPAPEVSRTFVFSFGQVDGAMEVRGRIAKSVWQPAAVDYLNPQAAEEGRAGRALHSGAAVGTERLLARYVAELDSAEVLEGSRESAVWGSLGEMGPQWISDGDGLR
jgi:hypothetical protein